MHKFLYYEILRRSDPYNYSNRIVEINRLLDLLDLERPESPRINRNILLTLPPGEGVSTEYIEEEFRKDKDKFFLANQRFYAISTDEKEWIRFMEEDTGLAFCRKDFSKYTLINDYFSQIVLKELTKWEEENIRETKSQE